MDRMLYVAMTGAREIMEAQAINANNLANVGTTGFCEDLVQFRSVQVFGPGYPSRVYAMAEHPGVSFAPGDLINTGGELDVAIDGNGWIAVQSTDGTEAYTRSGNLQISNNGLLITNTGLLVLGDNGPISVPPAEKMEIGRDGTISVFPLGQEASSMVVLDRIKLVKMPLTELVKGEDGLMRSDRQELLPADASVKLVSGTLESSNVNAVSALVNMIDLSRKFEMQIKIMHTAQENDAKTAELLRI
ncbi:MAG: flagellar basal-body rod protein FlgF [Thermodesulfobacteriota bacterium]|nr:flagellar basal-body rod protein FlgF [Thermodesulfobacteriota bacterium]